MSNSNKAISYPSNTEFSKGRQRKKLKFGSRTRLHDPRYNRRNPGYFEPYQINDTAAFVPEMWAEEGVRTLVEQMVYGSTVHRDFDNEVANFGEVVHTRSVGELSGKRKQNDMDNVEDQDVSATDIEVRLNQRVYVSFLIGDGERSKSFKDLISVYLEPGMRGNSRLLDQVLGGQVYQFLDNVAGGLGSLTKTNSHDYLLDARQVMNDNKVGLENRWLGLTSPSETYMQKTEMFKKADEIGDAGQALRNALLGRVAGFNTFLELNTPSVRGATTATSTTTTAAASAGATVIAMTAVTNLPVGAYFTVVGDMTPLRVSSVSSLNVTPTRPLKYAVGSGAVVQPYALGAIDQASAVSAGQTHSSAASGYPANWMKELVVDGTGVPKVGQLVSFATAGTPNVLHAAEYCIIQVTNNGSDYSILLDRPLEQAVLDGDVVCYGPTGDYNFAYQRDALTLVNRPMALPVSGAGARAALATFENISLRVVITYDGQKEAHRVVIGGLFGVKTLNTDLGAALLG